MKKKNCTQSNYDMLLIDQLGNDNQYDRITIKALISAIVFITVQLKSVPKFLNYMKNYFFYTDAKFLQMKKSS